MATFSTALLRMVEGVVVGQEGVVRVVVGVGVVTKVVTRSATLVTIFPARSVSPAVMLAAGLTVVPMDTTSAGAVVVEDTLVLTRGVVVVLITRVTTLSTMSNTGAMVVEAMLMVASASSKILEG